MSRERIMLTQAIPAVQQLRRVQGFDPLRFLKRNASGGIELEPRYQRLWFRLACPDGKMLLNRLQITDQIAVYEAQVFLSREDNQPIANFTAAVEKAGLLDICGIFAVPLKTENIAARTTALPDMFAPGIDLALASSMPEESDSYAPGCRGNDLTEIFQLREYAPGDDLRRIHWKMTAKTDRLIVREASLPLQRSLLVFWDKTAADKLAPDAADALAESVSSVCQSLSEAGFAYTLGWSGEGQNVLEEVPDTDRLLALLPRMVRSAGAGESGTAQLARQGGENFYGRVLLFAHAVPPEIEALAERCALTLLLCSRAETASPCRTVRFTPEDYAQRLHDLEFME